jgi:endonuclease/exonuclease/phosphatase family metal-dependent hydrolase
MKVATLNICGASPRDCKKFIDLFKSIKADIICLQEIPKVTAKKIQELTSYYIVWVAAGYLGNAVLSKYPIIKNEGIKLESLLTKQHTDEFRSAIKVTIECGTNKDLQSITLISTHLDHLHEETRLAQLAILKEHITDVDFLIGDFNSIYVEGYDAKKIEQINAVRRNNNFQLVRGDIIREIVKWKFNIHPFVDNTSRFDTRIDFIFWKKESKWFSRETIYDTIQDGFTDHKMVIAELTLN